MLWRRSRVAPLLVSIVALSLIVVLPSLGFGGGAQNLRIAGLPFGIVTLVITVAAAGVAAWQLWRLASSPRLPKATRWIAPAVALYAIAMIAIELIRHSPATEILAGSSPLPWWMSGGYIVGAILLPIGVVVSLSVLTIALVRRRPGRITAVAILALALSAFVVHGAELTRNGRPNLAQFVIPGSVAGSFAAANASSVEPLASQQSLGPQDNALAPFDGKDLDEIFSRVSAGVRYEPYRGILRGAEGTAIARSGNSFDRSLLLAELLRRAGYKVRFARGQLSDANIDVIIRGTYPPHIGTTKMGEEYAPYDPAADAGLRDVVRDHAWVEVFQGDTWLPLDASFPRAKAGEAYANAAEQFDAAPDNLYHTIEAHLREETANGQSRDLSTFSGRVADLSLRPISLVVHTIPQVSKGEAQTSGGPGAVVGGFGDALGGGSEPPPQPEKSDAKETIVGVAYVRSLTVAGKPEKVERTTVLSSDAGGALKRETLAFTIRDPSGSQRNVERVLFQSDDEHRQPAEERRYTISILGGRIPMSFAAQQTRIASAMLDANASDRQAKKLGDVSSDDPNADAAAAKLAEMGDVAGTAAGHLLALRFAAESDSLSRLIADGTGLGLAWDTPRILITGVEMKGKNEQVDAKVAIDLRLDEVHAYPYPGAPAGVVKVFNAARGIQESVIEGVLVAKASGRQDAANTARLMNAADNQSIPLVVINSSTRSRLTELARNLPANCADILDAALSKGHEVVIPSRAVALDNRQHWGWWEVDPATGEIIGVMQDGQHQGMVEYSASTERIGLNDKSGKVIGMMVGAFTAQGTLAALMLKYGQVTPELVKEVEATVSSILCNSCMFKAEAKASQSIKLSIGPECLKKDYEFKQEVGASAGVSFCESYNSGFKCAAAMVLASLKPKEPLAKLEYESGAELSLACDKKEFK